MTEDSSSSRRRIVKLVDLRVSEPSSIKTTCHFLRKDGFVFLDLTNDELLERAVPIMEAAGKFLESDNDDGGYQTTGSQRRVNNNNIHGHISGTYRDSIRLLSGSLFEMSFLNCSSSSSSPLTKLKLDVLTSDMDKAAKDVAEALATPLFECNTSNEIGELYFGGHPQDDTHFLPLLQKGETEEDSSIIPVTTTTTTDKTHTKKKKLSPPYGLVDIVRYHNNSEDGSLPDILVSQHTDPGLFVISLPESAPGLQLKERSSSESGSNNWISPPKGMGVLWMGSYIARLFAANDDDHYIPPCIHRVISNKEGIPRVACWHEICTSMQISEPMLRQMESNQQELVCGTIRGTQEVLDLLRQAENHELIQKEDEHDDDVVIPQEINKNRGIEPSHVDTIGIPMSKSSISHQRRPVVRREPKWNPQNRKKYPIIDVPMPSTYGVPMLKVETKTIKFPVVRRKEETSESKERKLFAVFPPGFWL